jgi:hypothetical protein
MFYRANWARTSRRPVWILSDCLWGQSCVWDRPRPWDRCGGRIYPLPTAGFGYPAEGGAEFVHGEAPVTHGLLREAGLSLLPIQGTQWTAEDGKLSRDETPDPREAELHRALQQLKDDLTVAEFLRRYFAGPKYGRLRHYIERMVEGYDAADPERASRRE